MAAFSVVEGIAAPRLSEGLGAHEGAAVVVPARHQDAGERKRARLEGQPCGELAVRSVFAIRISGVTRRAPTTRRALLELAAQPGRINTLTGMDAGDERGFENGFMLSGPCKWVGVEKMQAWVGFKGLSRPPGHGVAAGAKPARPSPSAAPLCGKARPRRLA